MSQEQDTNLRSRIISDALIIGAGPGFIPSCSETKPLPTVAVIGMEHLGLSLAKTYISMGISDPGILVFDDTHNFKALSKGSISPMVKQASTPLSLIKKEEKSHKHNNRKRKKHKKARNGRH